MFCLTQFIVRRCVPAVLVLALAAVTLVIPGPSSARAATPPQLPLVLLNTTYAPPTGPTITVAAGGDLQAALNTAQPGSVIVLPAGATYYGNFTLPAKSSAGWIYIQSSALSSLPAPGARVSPAQASLMPKIISPNASPAIQTAANATQFRLVGLELTTTAPDFNVVVDLSSSNIVIDRCYIHGAPTANGRRGVFFNGTALAIIDSYVSDFHNANVGMDAEAIMGYFGAGPFKIVNNYLEADGENILFGGWDPPIPNLVPADIEVRGNYFFKPLSWRVGDPAYLGIPWKVKNLFELKNARRVLIDGNVFENNWTGADQGGFAIVFTPRNQMGTAPWSAVQDITFTHNIVKRSTAGVNVLGWDNLQSSQQAQRILIRDNLFLDIGAFPDTIYNGYFSGMLFMVSDGPADLVIDHNTAIQTGSPMYAGTFFPSRWPATGFTSTNSIVPNNQGVGGAGSPLQTLNILFSPYAFARNALAGGLAINYPLDNFFPASLAQIGFVNLAGGDYHLAPGTPYKNAGTDGKDLGADIDALNAATATATSGAPPAGGPPILDVIPQTAVDFGTANVGASVDRSFTVTNTGGSTLTGAASSSGAFSVISGGSFSLAANTSQTVIVRFTPPAVGSFSNSVAFTSSVGTISRSVTGTGVGLPALSVTPLTAVDYGSVPMGGVGDRSFIVTNTGGGVLIGSASSAAPFTVISGSSFNLAASASQIVAVRFSPAAPGTYIGSVSFSSNAGTTSRSVSGTSPVVATPPPTVALTMPSSGSTVTSTISVSASASSTRGIAGVQFKIDGANLGAEVLVAPYTISWNTATAINGLHALTAVARDAAGSVTTSAAILVTANNTVVIPPPVISSIQVSGVTGTGGVVTWVTDILSDSQVEYGLTSGYGTVTTLDPTMVTAHTVTLSSLTGNTTYHYRVRSKSAAGGVGVSSDATLVTSGVTSSAPAPPPTAPPGSGSPPAGGAPPAGGPVSGGGGGAPGGSGGGLASVAPGGGSPPVQGGYSGGPAANPAPGPAITLTPVTSTQAQPVVWSRLVNVVSTGSTLTKTSGCDGCVDASAISQQEIAAGDGFFEFTASETSTTLLVGLHTGSSVAGQDDLQFAIKLQSNGMADIRERGILRTSIRYVRGDVFRISIVLGTIRYYKNGRLLYISGLPTRYPLRVAVLLSSRGASLTNPVISGKLSQGKAVSVDSGSATFAADQFPHQNRQLWAGIVITDWM